MISAELMGRLGNQMFIIAAAHSLAVDNDDKAVFSRHLSGITPTDRERAIHKNTILRKIKYADDLSFIENVYHEPTDHSYKKIAYKPNLFLRGYFQSEKYFAHNRKEILDLFSPLDQINSYLEKKYSDLINNHSFVSVHVRRGDYLKYSDYHAIMGKPYYDKAMKTFNKDCKFVFFSDDIEWCKETFPKSGNVFIENQDDILDLYLMSKIPNNIIGNSSFSWWAAWLNESSDKKVVAPSLWFGPNNMHLDRSSLTPESWEVI